MDDQMKRAYKKPPKAPQAVGVSTNRVCQELSREGERLGKSGEISLAVEYLERAVQAGTDDIALLSSIYCQLGNYYFLLQNYQMALKYHRLDLILAKKMGKLQDEAKSCCNLGNTLKQLGKYDEAISCYKRYLDLAKQSGDMAGESRVLFNLANVYHCQGKRALEDWNEQTSSVNLLPIVEVCSSDYEAIPQHIRICLETSAKYYEQNLLMVMARDDRIGEGRVCGNLGNVYYLLGKFQKAVNFHERRLNIAKEFGDKSAERRAYCNLGNVHLFSAHFDEAVKQYKLALQVAMLIKDSALIAQNYFNLGACYFVQRNFPEAKKYYLLHADIAEKLGDLVGTAKSSWSLCCIHLEMHSWNEAMVYCQRYYQLCQELGDEEGKLTAKRHIFELKQRLSGNKCDDDEEDLAVVHEGASNDPMTTDPTETDEDQLFNLLNKSQSRRMDEQRCSINAVETSTPSSSSFIVSSAQDEFFDLLVGVQGSRMNDQRASLSLVNTFPGLRVSSRLLDQLREDAILDGGHLPVHSSTTHRHSSVTAGWGDNTDTDAFLDMLMRLQATRINDQRSILPTSTLYQEESSQHTVHDNPSTGTTVVASTMPDEDFFAHIMRVQSSRLDEQRCNLPDVAVGVVGTSDSQAGAAVSASTSLPSMFSSKNRVKSTASSRKGSSKSAKSRMQP